MAIPPPPKVHGDWELDARETVCKLDAQTGRFVTRDSKPDDAGRTTFDDQGPEELLRLGAPSLGLSPDDYQWPQLVGHYGLQVLDAAGFINGPVPSEYASGFEPQGRLRHEHIVDPVHPVLRRDMWQNLTDRDWNLIQPSLHIASSLLDEPNVLRFFLSYFKTCTMYRSKLGHKIGRLEIPSYMSDRELQFVYGKMVEMRNCTSFKFESDTNITNRAQATAYGYTEPILDRQGLRKDKTFASFIWISEAFLETLRRQQDIDEYKERLNALQLYVHKADHDRTIHIDGASSELRTTLFLAIVILHEFNHAVALAAKVPDIKHPLVQPYFAGDIVNEVGFAFEKYIFNGSMGDIDSNEDSDEDALPSIQAPYGWRIHPRPTNWLVYRHDRPVEELPVPMSFVSSLFSRDFWEVSIERWGATELRCPLAWPWAVWANPGSGPGSGTIP